MKMKWQKLCFLNHPFFKIQSITQNTELLIQLCRDNTKQRTKLDVFMKEYGLSNAEGIALMCLGRILDAHSR